MEIDKFKNPNETDKNYDDLMAIIGKLFASVFNSDGLQRGVQTFDVKFGSKQVEENALSDNVIEFSNPDDNTGD
jgi:hypothetical protein